MSGKKFAEIKAADGKPLVQMFCPPNATDEGADEISASLYDLSEHIIRGLMPDQVGIGFGGRFGYGADFENDTFMMHRYCWCEKDDCPWCGGNAGPRFVSPNSQDEDCRAPHFWHKKSGLKIRWYKYIGRDMEMNRQSIAATEWRSILDECFASLPAEAIKKCHEEREYEARPEVIAAAEEARSRMFEVLCNPEKYGAPIRTHICDTCGKEYEYQEWPTVVVGHCDDCSRKMAQRIFGEK